MKRTKKILLGGGGLLLIGLAFVLIRFVLPSVAIFPTEWVTYRNSKYNYEFSYPKGWKLADQTENNNYNPGFVQRLTIDSPENDSYYSGGDWGITIWHRGIYINFVVDTIWSDLKEIEKENSHPNAQMRRVTYANKEYLMETNGSHYITLYTIGKISNKPKPVTFEILIQSGDTETLTMDIIQHVAESLKY